MTSLEARVFRWLVDQFPDHVYSVVDGRVLVVEKASGVEVRNFHPTQLLDATLSDACPKNLVRAVRRSHHLFRIGRRR